MESFGKILKTTREEKGIPLEVIAQEIAISSNYLVALEEEDLDAFPGATYASGFLRNYSDYLGSDTQYLLGLFRAKMLQEAPPPDDLLKFGKSKRFIIIVIILSVLGVALLGTGGFFVYKAIVAKQAEGKVPVNLGRVNPKTYNVGTNLIQERIYIGDIFEIPFESGIESIVVGNTLGSLYLNTPIGVQIVDLGEELELDINGNGKPDISIFVFDVSKTDASRGAEIRLGLKSDVATFAYVDVDDSEILSAADVAPTTKRTVLFSGTRAYPFTLIATFRGACLFRYKADNRDPMEDYFTSGDILNATSNNSIRLWMSNANAVKLQVQGDGKTADIEIGRPGQVLAEDIRWVREADGTYNLVVIEID